MIKYLKDTYFSKTTCRLLRSKLEKGLTEDQKTIEYFSKITFTDDVREKLYLLINGLREKPKCKNLECNKEVQFLNYSRGYRTFCCIKCSKNPEELKNINLFNGVNKIRETPHTEKTLYYKKCREITRLTYKQNENLLNPNNYKLGRAGVDGAYQVDHIISVNYGFINKLNPEIIGGIENLRVVPWRVNAVKNKYLEDIKAHSNIIIKYIKKEFNEEMNIENFIYEYCLDKSGRINSKINKFWFINRNVLYKYDEIMELTKYLDTSEKVPFRIFNIYYGLNKSKYKIEGNRATFMRYIWNPKSDWVEIPENEEDIFYCYDKSINCVRLKSGITKESANKQGLLYLYYKYL